MSDDVSFVTFYHDFDAVFPYMIRICTNCIPALYDAVLNMCVVPNIDIIQDDRIFNVAVVPDVRLFEYHGVFHYPVYDTAA